MRRTWITLTSLVLAAGLVTGCGSSGSDDADGEASAFSSSASGALAAWGFDNADEVGSSRVDYARTALSGVTIKVDATAFDAQKFTAQAASGQVPDVVQMDRSLVATYAAQDLIQPLDGCFSAHGVDPRTTYYPAVLGDVTYRDHVWAVPQFYQPPAIMLNERVLRRAGLSASDIDTSKPDELVANVKKMYKANGSNPSVLGLDPVAGGQASLWVLGYGGRTVGTDGAPTLSDPANVKGLQVLKQITDAQGGYAKVKSFSDSFDAFGDGNQFVKDQVGAQIDAQWYVNVLTPYVKKVQIQAVPFKGADGQPFTTAGGTSFVIPTAAKNKDAACAWALSVTSLQAWKAAGAARAKTLAKTPGAINTGLFTGSPAADEQLRSQYVKKSGNAGFDQAISTYYSIVAEGKASGTSPAGAAIGTELNNAVSNVLLGQKSPEQALKDAQTAAQRAYDQVPR